MTLTRAYTMRAARLVPHDGGAPVIPPDPDTGTGGGGGGGNVGAKMLLGITTEPASLAAFQADDAVMGPWSVHRAFDPGGIPSSWAASAAGWDVGRWASVYSCKPDPIAMAAGTLDGPVRTFLNSIPDSHTALVTIWHEADVKIKQGTAPWTRSQYLAAWRRFFGIVREVQAVKPHLYTTLIFGSYIYIAPKAGVTLADLWPGDGSDGRPLVDVLAFDGYSFTAAETGDYMWGAGRAFANSKGVAWGIAECGFSSGISSGAAAASWIETQAEYAATHGAGGHSSAAYLCWFNSTVGGVLQTPEHFSQTREKSAALSQQYLTPYTTWSLGGA